MNLNPINRGESRNYAYSAAAEGYQWGGGCWNTNGYDDSPGDPPENPYTLGEGPDCSGLHLQVVVRTVRDRETRGSVTTT